MFLVKLTLEFSKVKSVRGGQNNFRSVLTLVRYKEKDVSVGPEGFNCHWYGRHRCRM